MDFVITLLADPEKTPLTQAFAESMAPSLLTQAIAVTETKWLKEGATCEIFISSPRRGEAGRGASGERSLNSCPPPNFPPPGGGTINDLIRSIVADQPYDAIVQPYPKPRYRLFVADMESTIIENECLDELAEYVGLREKIEAITARAMNGELDFETALRERVALLKDLPESALQEVYDQKVRLMQGAKELMEALKKQGVYTMLVSGGFDFYASRIAKRLGFDEWRANRLEIRHGTLTGKVIPPILDKNAKLAALREGCAKLGISPGEAIAIGDGANDLPMLLAAGLGIAYHAKPSVRAEARARLDHADLSAISFLLPSAA